MKFSVSQKILRLAVEQVSRAASGKPPCEILHCVKLVADSDGFAILVCTDLNVRTEVPLAETVSIAETGECCVEVKNLRNALKAGGAKSNETVTLSAPGTKTGALLFVTVGAAASYQLRIVSAEDFPNGWEMPIRQHDLALPAAEFLASMKGLQPMLHPDDTRADHAGMFFAREANNAAVLGATNGHMLSVQRLPVGAMFGGADTQSVPFKTIFSDRLVELLCAEAKGAKGLLRIGLHHGKPVAGSGGDLIVRENGRAWFQFSGGALISGVLIGQRWPDYTQVQLANGCGQGAPDNIGSIRVNRTALIEACKQIPKRHIRHVPKLVRAVHLTVEEGEGWVLRLAGGEADASRVELTVPLCSVQDFPPYTGINADYLRMALEAATGEVVEIRAAAQWTPKTIFSYPSVFSWFELASPNGVTSTISGITREPDELPAWCEAWIKLCTEEKETDE